MRHGHCFAQGAMPHVSKVRAVATLPNLGLCSRGNGAKVPMPGAPEGLSLPAGRTGRAAAQKTPPQLMPGLMAVPPTSAASMARTAGRSTPQLSNSHTASS